MYTLWMIRLSTCNRIRHIGGGGSKLGRRYALHYILIFFKEKYHVLTLTLLVWPTQSEDKKNWRKIKFERSKEVLSTVFLTFKKLTFRYFQSYKLLLIKFSLKHEGESNSTFRRGLKPPCPISTISKLCKNFSIHAEFLKFAKLT